MPLNIDPSDREGIVVAKRLAPAVVSRLVDALNEAPPVSNPDEMAERLTEYLSGISKERLVALLRTLYTLYFIRDLSGVSLSRFLDDLIEAASKDQRLKSDDLPVLRDTLEKLLNIKPLLIVAKAARLQRDGERLYCTSKVLSDIRPVFNDNPSSAPAGAVITHTLKVAYHEGPIHRDVQIVLDSDDLADLEKVIHRAQLKDKSLRAFLKRSKLPNLGD